MIIGPILFGFLLGIIISLTIRETTFHFTLSSYIVIFIVVLGAGYFLGQFDFYYDIPLASGFVSGACGLIIGKLLFKGVGGE